MIIYYDGSETTSFGTLLSKDRAKAFSNRRLIAWGVHALKDNMVIEHASTTVIKVNHKRGLHETFALINAVNLAVAEDVSPEKCTFITDDEVAVYASQEAASYKDLMLKHLGLVGAILNSSVAHVEEYLAKSRFTKVAAHKGIVNNHRVDYLAKNARNRLIGVEENQLSYDDWLKQIGLIYWRGGHRIDYVPPFTRETPDTEQ